MVSISVRGVLAAILLCCCMLPLQAAAKSQYVYREVLLLQMYDWMGEGLRDEIENIPAKNIHPIHLKNGETAYLAAGTFKRGRNGWLGTLLVRPAVQEVTDVSDLMKEFDRYDFDNDGVTEVYAEIWADGGGSTYRTFRWLHFDGSTPKTLIKAEYEDHSGARDGLDYKHVDWKIYEIDGVTYLAESKETRTEGKVEGAFSAYAFANDKFVAVNDEQLVQQIQWLYDIEGQPVSEDNTDYKHFSYNPSLNKIAKVYNSTSTKPVLPLDVEFSQYRVERIASNPQFAQEYAVHVLTRQLEVTPWWTQGHVLCAELYARMGRLGSSIQEMERFLAFDTGEQSIQQAQTQIEIWKGQLRQLPLPEMVAIPAGEFLMGTSGCSKFNCRDEVPPHRVQVQAFELAKTVLTCEQWNACVADGGCQGWRACGNRGLQFQKINENQQQYIDWINAKTGKRYRLPTEAEWEYAARAGTMTEFYWGEGVNASAVDMEFRDYIPEIENPKVMGRNALPKLVGSYPPNAFGLYDMIGYIPQLTQDCYVDNYVGAPTDGSARVTDDCSDQVLRGGEAGSNPGNKRSAYRVSKPKGRFECGEFALRLARTLE